MSRGLVKLKASPLSLLKSYSRAAALLGIFYTDLISLYFFSFPTLYTRDQDIVTENVEGCSSCNL